MNLHPTLALPGCAPLGMAADGTLFVTTYQSQKDIQVFPPGAMAPALVIPDANPLVNLGSSRGHLAALSSTRVVWVDQSLRLRAYGFNALIAQVPEAARFPTLLEPSAGVVLVLYVTQSGRMIVHPFADASKGWLCGVNGFGFTGWRPAPGLLECCWTTGETNVGEVGPVTRQRIDLAEDPPQPFPPLDPLPDIAVPDYPVYVGFSWVPSGHVAPGNCQFLTPMADEPTQDDRLMADPTRPVFASGDTIARHRPLQLLGQLGSIEGAGPTYNYRDSAAYWSYLQECAYLGTRPTFVDDDGPDLYPQGILDRLPPGGLPVSECYPRRGETPAETIARLDAKILDLIARGKPFGVVVPNYTQQDAWLKASSIAICARVPYWINLAKGLLVVVWIFPRERGGVGGPLEDPDMFELGNRLAAALMVRGVPELPALEPALHDPVDPIDPMPIVGPLPTPTPRPQPEPIGGSVKLPAGNYKIDYDANGTLTFTPIAGSGGSAVIDYTEYHNALVEVRAARAAKGQGPNDDIDGYRLLQGVNGSGVMDLDAVKAAI